MQTDVIIIGSGIAGLSLALKLNDLNKQLKICILSKGEASECNTRYAQGGIAAVMNKLSDSFENHIQDTLACGKGLCNKKIVEMVVHQAPDRINDLLSLGANFDVDLKNNFHLALEGGHSLPRVVHHKDKTGFEVETVLLKQIRERKNIQLVDNALVVDLIINKSETEKYCIGVKLLNQEKQILENFYASTTILASGGCGQVYLNTTNPLVASGDGYAMAHRAGGKIKNMRFMQFHPTSLYRSTNQSVSFLISEALRGFGAHIVDGNQKRFLYAYDSRGELATRDVISSAIHDYLQAKGIPCVYLDLRHLNLTQCKRHFPQIFAEFQKSNLNPKYDLIPITPSAHYQCGGVVVDKNAQTHIGNLFAVGEVAYTGLHGANRLASNSLLEALVFSHNAAIKINRDFVQSNTKQVKSNHLDVKLFSNKQIKQHISQLKKTMMQTAFSNDLEILVNANKLSIQLSAAVEQELKAGYYSTELLTLRNLSQTAHLMLSDKLEFHSLNKQEKVIPYAQL